MVALVQTVCELEIFVKPLAPDILAMVVLAQDVSQFDFYNSLDTDILTTIVATQIVGEVKFFKGR